MAYVPAEAEAVQAHHLFADDCHILLAHARVLDGRTQKRKFFILVICGERV